MPTLKISEKAGQMKPAVDLLLVLCVYCRQILELV